MLVRRTRSVFLHLDILKLTELLTSKGYELVYIQNELQDLTEPEVAIIDQIICSNAFYFIGTHESTFSFTIQEQRQLLGYKPWTIFNRFCHLRDSRLFGCKSTEWLIK